MSEKMNTITKTSNILFCLMYKLKLGTILKSFSTYFFTILSHHNERFLEQHVNPGIKEHSHHHPQYFKCDYYLHHNIKHKQSLSYMFWFMSLLIVSFFSPSKVSAHNDRLVIVEPSSRIKIASPTHSFISGLSTRNPVTRKYFDQSLDKDVNRLVDRSENIIKMQDEEESQMIQPKVKPAKDSKDFRCPLQLFLERGLIKRTISRVGDTINVGCNPRYKLTGPTRITCTALQYLYKTVVKWDLGEKQFCKKILEENFFDIIKPLTVVSQCLYFGKNIPWDLYSMQLKLMLDSVYICRFLKKKDVCRGLLIYYYINIPRLKCKLYHFRNCYSSAKQFTFK